MYHCYKHGWTSRQEICPTCHPVETFVSDSTADAFIEQLGLKVIHRKTHDFSSSPSQPIEILRAEIDRLKAKLKELGHE